MQNKNKKNTEISERIKLVIDFLCVTPNEFAKKLNYERSQTIYDILNCKSAPSFDFFNRLFNSEYSEIISSDWLITGKGEMKKEVEKKDGIRIEQSFSLRTDHSLDIQSIPLYDSEIAAGLVSLFLDHPLSTPIHYIQIPNLPKSDGAIYVRGDSMYPVLKSHDIVIYKEVKDLSNHIFIYGEMYIVCFDNDGDDYTMVKWVHKSDLGNDYIKLVSENKHHDAIDIPTNKIKALAMIKASIRVNSMH